MDSAPVMVERELGVVTGKYALYRGKTHTEKL